MVKIKFNPANKNLSYLGNDSFIENVPRDKVFACVAPQSKMHFLVYSVGIYKSFANVFKWYGDTLFRVFLFFETIFIGSQ